MIQDKEAFEDYYKFQNDESLRGHRDKQGIIEFLTTERYMKRTIPPQSSILDACAGCGVYSFFLADLGHTVTSGDYVDHNVQQIRERQAEHPVLHDIYQGSAVDLSRFPDEKFNVVLNMGAYYHITDNTERERSVSECLRVLKHGGLFFLAYLNKYSNIIKHHVRWKENFQAFENILTRGYSDEDSLFYQSSPEETEELVMKHSLEILHHVAADGFKCTITDTINSMDDSLFERYMEYHYKVCEVKSILGFSEHALIICKKI